MALLGVYKGRYVSAKSASEEIDALSIIKGCEAVDSCANHIDFLSDSISVAGSEISADSLLIDDKTIDGSLNECCDSINAVYDNILSVTAQIRERVESIYNSLQEKYNDEARRKDKKIIEEKMKMNNTVN